MTMMFQKFMFLFKVVVEGNRYEEPICEGSIGGYETRRSQWSGVELSSGGRE